MLQSSYDHLYVLKDVFSLFNSLDEKSAILEPLHKIEQKIRFFEEDLNTTIESFSDKSSVKNKQIQKTTLRYADTYYRTRLYEICRMLIPCLSQMNLNDEVAKLGSMTPQLLAGSKYGFNTQEEFKNPYPAHLFFSQTWHADHFSTKSQRLGVMGERLEVMKDRLRRHEIGSDDLRVNMYFAPFRNQLHPFVYNNRTWVVFSGAGVDATRIVPTMPTQDLLNRITAFSADHNPNIIFEEGDSARPVQTVSLRPGL